VWKDKNVILEPDRRFKSEFGTGPDGRMSIQDLYDLLDPLTLSETVPTEIRDQFDIARKVYLYSWFEYEFATVSEQKCYSVVEAALRLRASIANSGLREKAGMAEAIEHAVSQGWLSHDEFSTDTSLSGLNIIRLLRNDLAHGKAYLFPGGTLTMMALSKEVIERLFESTQRA
jgi:hypothetical protein